MAQKIGTTLSYPRGTDPVGFIHGRYTNWAPKPLVAVDIFRIVNGKLVEYGDVMQEEVPVEKAVNGNPMFTPVIGE